MRLICRRAELRHQMNPKAIYDKFALVPEINRDTPSDIALHLSHAPIRLVRMAHQHAGSQNGIQIIQIRTLP